MACLFDEFETFNYDIGEVGAKMLTQLALSAEPNSANTQLHLMWRPFYINDIRKSDLKRSSDGITWTTLLSATDVMEYFDASVQPGQKYIYQLLTGGTTNANAQIRAGINIPAPENRGGILLLVETNQAAALSTELVQLKQDLVGDGWTVYLMTNAPRHTNYGWDNTPTNIGYNSSLSYVKSAITNLYNSNTNLKAIYIIGHVIVPYSGTVADDGHPDHGAAWPADSYYGYINDSGWQDQITFTNIPGLTNILQSFQMNYPGDHKWDQDYFPSSMKLAVGRIDFDWQTTYLASASETDLLKRYLKKIHRYRLRETTLPNRAIVATYFGVEKKGFGDNLGSKRGVKRQRFLRI